MYFEDSFKPKGHIFATSVLSPTRRPSVRLLPFDRWKTRHQTQERHRIGTRIGHCRRSRQFSPPDPLPKNSANNITARSERQLAQGSLPACLNRTEQSQNRLSAEVPKPKGIRSQTSPPRFTPEQNKPKPLWQPHIAQFRSKLLRINLSSPACGTRTEQSQTPPAAANRAAQAEAPLDQSLVSGLRHPNRTNPNPSGKDSGQAEKHQKTNRQPPHITSTEQTQAPKPSSKVPEETY